MIEKIKLEIKKRKLIFGFILAVKNIPHRWIWFFPFLHKRYKPALRIIGLDITSGCNLSCYNCEASCRQAPTNEYMTLEQIEKFIRESIGLNWRWDKITLRGGEPTLYPNFFDVLKIIKQYKEFRPECDIGIISNGYGDKVNRVLENLPEWVSVVVAQKSGPSASINYGSYNVAPCDLRRFHSADFSKGCWRSEICNIGLSRYGYYPCSPGANVDRVFGFDVGIKKLSQVNSETLSNQMKILCRYCGHYKEPNEVVLKEKMSRAWKDAYKKYKGGKPKLKLY